MTRVEFKLTMPGAASWNGKWSGDGRNHTLVHNVDDAEVDRIDGRSWSYSWPDGWRAEVTARVVKDGEPLALSHAFKGYDWMVTSILRYGEIYADHEVLAASAPD